MIYRILAGLIYLAASLAAESCEDLKQPFPSTIVNQMLGTFKVPSKSWVAINQKLTEKAATLEARVQKKIEAAHAETAPKLVNAKFTKEALFEIFSEVIMSETSINQPEQLRAMFDEMLDIKAKVAWDCFQNPRSLSK